MTEYTIDMIKGTTVMEQMRSLIKVVIDFINNEGGDVEEVRQMVLTEIADRTAQDGQLQLQIQAEATARISQDNSLQTQIQAETVQRIDADDTLQADIGQEQQIREQSDGNIETSLNTEISQRQYEDTQLRGDLESEQRSRQNQDTQLDTAIQNEASQRASADTGIRHDITDLTTRVGTVETSVSDIIQGTQPVGAAQNQGHADTQSEAQVGDHVVSTTAVIGDDTHPVKIVNGVPVQVSGSLGQDNKVSKLQSTNTTINVFSDFVQKLTEMGIGNIVTINSLNLDSDQVSGQSGQIRNLVGMIKSITSTSITIQCLSGNYMEIVSGAFSYWNIIISAQVNLNNSRITLTCSNDASSQPEIRYGTFANAVSVFDLQT